MLNLKYIFSKIKDVKFKDYLSIFPMITALLIKPLYKQKYTNTWLICEEPLEARDNGYYFFKYICEHHLEQKCFYAIKKESIDYEKVKDLGSTIEYGSIQHWIAYFLCQYNISSQKGGKPNAALCSFMELNGIFKPNNIFLQHGIIINNLKWLYAKYSKIDTFITSTIPETEYIQNHFGYSKETILLSGMPRFDTLHDYKTQNNQILIMPTWRYWFNIKSKMNRDTDIDFDTSEYFKMWLRLLNSSEMEKLISEYELKVIFYLHRNLQKHINSFKKLDNPIILASWKEYDIQELLKSSSLMITDYSSVFFDMVYMKKPIIFYQFDNNKYRKYQYAKGYFDYKSNPFGQSFENYKDVLECLKKHIKSRYSISLEYLNEHKRIFKYWDNNNSERIYNYLKCHLK